MSSSKIAPALDNRAEFHALTKGTARHIAAMRQEAVFADGAVPARTKALAAMLWAISARCEPCIDYYVQQAVRHGATEAELGEFFAVAATMGGCVGEMWAMKAFAAYKGSRRGTAAPKEASGCCP
jgi:AhpD family alkylhydroperoxidase